jgi:hypothetical protein
MVEEEIAREVTWIRNNMQQLVHKQSSVWIQKGVKTRLQSLPPPLPALAREQIQEVIQKEQPKDNSVLQRTQQINHFQKEKEEFVE